MLSQVRSAFLLLLLILCNSGCRAQFGRCKDEIAALAQALPHLEIYSDNSGSAMFGTGETPVLITKLLVNRPGLVRSEAAGSSLSRIIDEYQGNSADAEDFYGRSLSIAAYAGDRSKVAIYC